MPSKKSRPKLVPRPSVSGGQPSRVRGSAAPPTISGRWLLTAVALTLAAAAFCVWGTLCLLFWQGSWQLLYHPAREEARTPASAGVAFDPVQFASTGTGVLRLQGWWVPSPAPSHANGALKGSEPDPGAMSRFTVLYLHGRNGNLGNTVDALARLHGVGVNVFAFDYRGYGKSQFVRPSEARWREDAGWALAYLTGTRHIAPGAIVLDGAGLGANLALQVAAAHPELAGVILGSPLQHPLQSVFSDPRARLVPARLLVRDRFQLDAPAAALRIPSLWFLPSPGNFAGGEPSKPAAFEKVSAPKTLVWLPSGGDREYAAEISRWLDGLKPR